MPKNTFLNLPQDKRDRILEAAIDEFAEYTYHQASITRIVEKAEIAKGSFYQYFEDKKDLFKYILALSGEKKLAYLTNIMKDLDNEKFFQIIRELYIAGIKFAKEVPKLSAIAHDFVKNGDPMLKQEILGTNIPKSNQLFEYLLKKNIEQKDIDPNIDIKLVAFLLTSLSISISEYFIKEVKSQDDMEIMDLVDEMLYVIENGIKNKDGGMTHAKG
ncbi:TetR/AcrR family transcriptional regulator [Clostridiaceae bacterium 35-E11]